MHSAWQDSTVWGLVLGGTLLLIALRLIQNYLPGRKPPVFEGVPYIGGILKFSKVNALTNACQSQTLLFQLCNIL